MGGGGPGLVRHDELDGGGWVGCAGRAGGEDDLGADVERLVIVVDDGEGGGGLAAVLGRAAAALEEEGVAAVGDEAALDREAGADHRGLVADVIVDAVDLEVVGVETWWRSAVVK